MSQNSPELKAFIRENADLFWYTPDHKKEDISHELLVEHILNYGSLDDVRKLFNIMGIENVAKVFFNSIEQSERKKGNYHELTINYFTLIFNASERQVEVFLADYQFFFCFYSHFLRFQKPLFCLL